MCVGIGFEQNPGALVFLETAPTPLEKFIESANEIKVNRKFQRTCFGGAGLEHQKKGIRDETFARFSKSEASCKRQLLHLPR